MHICKYLMWRREWKNLESNQGPVIHAWLQPQGTRLIKRGIVAGIGVVLQYHEQTSSKLLKSPFGSIHRSNGMSWQTRFSIPMEWGKKKRRMYVLQVHLLSYYYGSWMCRNHMMKSPVLGKQLPMSFRSYKQQYPTNQFFGLWVRVGSWHCSQYNCYRQTY
jgi:hypothetical protein